MRGNASVKNGGITNRRMLYPALIGVAGSLALGYERTASLSGYGDADPKAAVQLPAQLCRRPNVRNSGDRPDTGRSALSRPSRWAARPRS